MRDFSLSLPMALLKARESVMARFRPILQDHGLTEQQWRVIRALYDTNGLEVTELAECTLLLMPSLTRILKSLEERNLVKRASVKGDNRRRLIRISPRGCTLYSKIAPLSEAEYWKLEQRIGGKKLEEFYLLLDKFY